MKLSLWTKRRQRPGIIDKQLVQNFESLGDNCEFGLVQRFSGVEPLGLLRFAGSSLDALIEGLDTDFSAYGVAGDLELWTDANGVTYCRSVRYGFPYIVSDSSGLETADAILRRETAKLAYLKRRMLEDLAAGEKILVRKGDTCDHRDNARRLQGALRRHGPAILLYVVASDSETKPGRVSRETGGYLLGRLRRFAPYERAGAIELGDWLQLCANAHALSRGDPQPVRRATQRNLTPWLDRRGRHHRPGSGAPVPAADDARLEVFGYRQDVRALTPDVVHVFSAWIWIPHDFAGTALHPAIGHLRLAWRYPDLTKRDCWQFVWVSAVVPRDYRIVVAGFVVVGAEETGFLSRTWRFEEGAAPTETKMPTS